MPDIDHEMKVRAVAGGGLNHASRRRASLAPCIRDDAANDQGRQNGECGSEPLNCPASQTTPNSPLPPPPSPNATPPPTPQSPPPPSKRIYHAPARRKDFRHVFDLARTRHWYAVADQRPSPLRHGFHVVVDELAHLRRRDQHRADLLRSCRARSDTPARTGSPSSPRRRTPCHCSRPRSPGAARHRRRAARPAAMRSTAAASS